MSKETKEITTKITVVAKQTSRFRAGLQFTQEPRDVEVTDQQLQAIKGDPLLAIVVPEKKTEAAKA